MSEVVHFSGRNHPLPKNKEKDVLIWLEMYRNDILDAWNDCQAKPKRQPKKIPPLY